MSEIEKALALFTSVIQSGEPWTRYCGDALVGAQAELFTLRAKLAQCRGELQQRDERHKELADTCNGYLNKLSRVTSENERLTAERDTLKQSHAKLLEDYENANAEADTLKGENERWNAGLAADSVASQKQLTSHRLLLDEMGKACRALTRNLLAAVSAYEAKALKRDSFGITRLADFNRAIELGKATLTKYQQQCGEKVKV